MIHQVCLKIKEEDKYLLKEIEEALLVLKVDKEKYPNTELSYVRIVFDYDYKDTLREQLNNPISGWRLVYKAKYADDTGVEVIYEAPWGTKVEFMKEPKAFPRKKMLITGCYITNSTKQKETIMNIKENYWKDGYILITRNNGPAVISSTLAFADGGCINKNSLDDNLLQEDTTSKGERIISNDVMSIWVPKYCSQGFNVFSNAEVVSNCLKIWERDTLKEMTIAEIECQLGLRSGSLRIKK